MNSVPVIYPHVAVSLDNLAHNVLQIQKSVPKNIEILAVVKDLAYGCGSVPVTKALIDLGVSHFAIATTQEAMALRNAGIQAPVLVLGVVSTTDLVWGADKNISFTINSPEQALLFAQSSSKASVHLHIDSGMNRLGILPYQLSDVLTILHKATAMDCTGAYTHLASADVPGTATVQNQLTVFAKCLQNIRNAGFSPTHIHYANSAGFLRFPALTECTLVRPGITLYGCKPDPAQDFPIDLRPIVSLVGCIERIVVVPANTPISYCGRYVTPQQTRIATINLGYGIGLPRKLTNIGSVLIGGRVYPIAGTVTMDYIMADIGLHSKRSVGEEVVAMGYQGEECISPDQMALQCNTIGYEILCGLSAKLDRYYVKNNETVQHIPGNYY